MEINYKTQDSSIEIKLVYIVKHKLMFYGAGKSWPIVTQCLLFENGLLVGFGEVIKHNDDVDNRGYALKEATKRVMDKIRIRFIRKDLWKLVLDETNKL